MAFRVRRFGHLVMPAAGAAIVVLAVGACSNSDSSSRQSPTTTADAGSPDAMSSRDASPIEPNPRPDAGIDATPPESGAPVDATIAICARIQMQDDGCD